MTPHGKSTRAIVALVLLLAIYAGWGIYSAIIGVPGPYFSSIRTQFQRPAQNREVVRDTAIAVTHSVSKSVHTYTGIVNTPACQQIGSGLRTVGTDPVRIQILLNFTPMPGACTQQGVSGKPFLVSFTAPKDAKNPPVFDGIFLNGVSVDATVTQE